MLKLENKLQTQECLNGMIVLYYVSGYVKMEMQEDAKLLRKRNVKVFSDILDNMPSLTYCTTWSETQQMLLDNPQFTEDPDLQSR